MGKYLHKSKSSVLLVAGGIILGSLALAVFFPTSRTRAEDREYKERPLVIENDSVVFGRTFGQWDAAWQQWAYSMEVAHHPLFDAPGTDCSTGQTGPVWFLGGKFCANGAACSFTGVVRNCTVPYGKALYFPVLNGEDSAVEESLAENPNNELAQQINFMRAVTDGPPPPNIFCEIDGMVVPDLIGRHRVKSDAFMFTIPNDNLLKAIYGNASFTGGTYYPAVDDGYYVMLGRLSRGSHKLHFGGGSGAGGFNLEVTYHLHVQ